MSSGYKAKTSGRRCHCVCCRRKKHKSHVKRRHVSTAQPIEREENLSRHLSQRSHQSQRSGLSNEQLAALRERYCGGDIEMIGGFGTRPYTAPAAESTTES